MLKEVKVPIIGVIENMKIDNHPIQHHIKKLNIPYITDIPFDNKIEAAIGDVQKLQKTNFAKKIKDISHLF